MDTCSVPYSAFNFPEHQPMIGSGAVRISIKQVEEITDGSDGRV